MAPTPDAQEWIRFCRRLMEENGIPWGYWEFIGKEFGLFDAATGTWDEDKLEALGL